MIATETKIASVDGTHKKENIKKQYTILIRTLVKWCRNGSYNHCNAEERIFTEIVEWWRYPTNKQCDYCVGPSRKNFCLWSNSGNIGAAEQGLPSNSVTEFQKAQFQIHKERLEHINELKKFSLNILNELSHLISETIDLTNFDHPVYNPLTKID